MKAEASGILEMGRGAIMERANYEMQKIVENILDENTKAESKRVLTLKLTFSPSGDRSKISVEAQAASKLAPLTGIMVGLCVGRSGGEYYAKEMSAEIPGQLSIDDPDEASLKLNKAANLK